MNSSTSMLLQSKYFTPTFNTAIFDGAVRVYFAQAQEGDALKIYMRLRDFFACMPQPQREHLRVQEFESEEARIFVLLYPNEETFDRCFDSQEIVSMSKLEGNYVIGVKGPYEEEKCDNILSQVKDILMDWCQAHTA